MNTIPIRSTFRLSDPIVDSTNQTAFLFFPAYPSFDLTVMEFDTSGTLLGQVGVGALGGDASVFTGAFDHRYFVNRSSGLLYFAGDVSSVASLYSVGFTGKTMNSSASGPLFLSTSSFTSEPTRLTEFYNPSFSVAPDRLFVPIEENCAGGPSGDGCVESVNISNGLPSGILNSYSVLGFSSPPPMSGIIVDNVSASAEASSIYFEATPPAGPSSAAIKLTQSGLQ